MNYSKKVYNSLKYVERLNHWEGGFSHTAVAYILFLSCEEMRLQ